MSHTALLQKSINRLVNIKSYSQVKNKNVILAHLFPSLLRDKSKFIFSIQIKC